MYDEETFFSRLILAATTEQKSLVPEQKPNEQRKNPFLMYSLSPNFPQLHQSAGGHPYIASLAKIAARPQAIDQ
jgi:hypothetical protein